MFYEAILRPAVVGTFVLEPPLEKVSRVRIRSPVHDDIPIDVFDRLVVAAEDLGGEH
jgi:hypothetical protein